MKTILQIAKEIGVSKQAVYKRFKGRLYTEVYPYVHTTNGTTYIEEQGETILKRDFDKTVDISDIDTIEKNERTDTVLDTLICMLKTELEVKNKQLEMKDKQIEELTAAIRLQAESINAANKNELAETIIDGSKLIQENNPKKGGFFSRFKRKSGDL